jgi:hypothetical protein
MANTTNYNWETPDDTDLVKDGAAAIRTLGSSIDTTTKNLNPQTTTGALAYRSATANVNTALPIGSTGQVLTVAAGVPSWATPTTGDIEGVTAGTGISGGGTSGTVTITNSMATAIDAKGDLVVGTGADTFARLAVGTNTYILTADSAEATGLKWAAPAGGVTFVGCGLKATGEQTINNSTETLVTWDDENFDSNGFHDNSTNNSRITIPSGKSGYYQVNYRGRWDDSTTGTRQLRLRKNGTDIARIDCQPGNTFPGSQFADIFYLAATDYIQVVAYQESGSNILLRKTSGQGTFSVALVGA